jgi:hypothetical protein
MRTWHYQDGCAFFFQGFSSGMGTDIAHQIRDNNIAKERGIVCDPFANVAEAMDPSDGPKNRKQELFCINLLSDPFWNFIS